MQHFYFSLQSGLGSLMLMGDIRFAMAGRDLELLLAAMNEISTRL
jgi:hypothetical protein